MQNRYTGDIGDFGKFGLLRALCGQNDSPSLKLAVVWYLVPDELRNEDGKHINYLLASASSARQLRFRSCDVELYDAMRGILVGDSGKVILDRRRVATIEASCILPSATLFFNTPLTYQRTFVGDRLSIRTEWFGRALQSTGQADVIFLDPDNGIECPSVRKTDGTGPKYVFWEEVEALTARDQTLIVYHHLNRSRPHAEQVKLLRQKFSDRMPPGYTTFHVVFRRGTCRAYFITAPRRHRDVIAQRLSKMLATPWAKYRHFPPEMAYTGNDSSVGSEFDV